MRGLGRDWGKLKEGPGECHLKDRAWPYSEPGAQSLRMSSPGSGGC